MSRGVSLQDFEVENSGDLSSKDYNDHMGEIQEDLIEAYRRESILDIEQDEFRTASVLSNELMQAQMAELNANAAVAASSYAEMATQVQAAISAGLMTDEWYPGEFWHNDFFTIDNLLFIEGAEVEREYGQVVLTTRNAREWTHLPQVPDADGNIVASPYITVYLDSEETVELDREAPEYNIVGDNNRIFLERRDQAFEKSLVIKTPPGGRPLLNHVGIKPFPNRFTNVLSLEYDSGSGWLTVPGFTPQTSSKDLSLHFNASRFEGRRLRMKLGSSETSGAHYLGVQQLFADYRDYEEEGRVYLKYTAESPGVTHLTGIDLQYTVTPFSAADQSDLNPVDIRIVQGSQITSETAEEIKNATAVFSTETGDILFDKTDTPLDIRDFGVPQSTIYVEIILRKISETTPVLDYITLFRKYEP